MKKLHVCIAFQFCIICLLTLRKTDTKLLRVRRTNAVQNSAINQKTQFYIIGIFQNEKTIFFSKCDREFC